MQYNLLLKGLFAEFEEFLANSNIPNKYVGSGGDAASTVAMDTDTTDALDRLSRLLVSVCPLGKSRCGRIFEENEPTFRCKCVSHCVKEKSKIFGLL